MNLDNYKGDVDIKPTNSENDITCSSQNQYVNIVHNFMHLSYLPPTKNMYCQEYILNKKFLFVAIKCDIKGIKEF